MRTLDIGYGGNMPQAQSQNVYTVTRQTQEQMEKAIRENWKCMDDMLNHMEPGQNLGAFPFGYASVNTTR